MLASIAGSAAFGQPRRTGMALLLALGVAAGAAPALAETVVTPAAVPAQAQAATADPSQAVTAFETSLLAIMKAGQGTPFVQRFNALATVVDRTFDLETILRNSVGLQWSSMAPDQRAALLATFRRYTIATWVANFSSWSGQRFSVSEPRHVGNDVVVPTKLVPQNGAPVNLSYVMRQAGTGWRVVDVLAEGSISRVAVQRSDFRSLLANGGVPALIASLQQKISSLSDGSLA